MDPGVAWTQCHRLRYSNVSNGLLSIYYRRCILGGCRSDSVLDEFVFAIVCLHGVRLHGLWVCSILEIRCRSEALRGVREVSMAGGADNVAVVMETNVTGIVYGWSGHDLM